MVQIHGNNQEQKIGPFRRSGQKSGWHSNHQGGQSGGFWKISVHGEQLCRQVNFFRINSLLRMLPDIFFIFIFETTYASIGNRHFFHYIMSLSGLPKL